MITLLTVLHVIFCLFLILVILLQTGKGGGMGTAFGGSSQSVFGPRGAGSFIGKLTGIVATLFMLTSLTLAYLSSSTSSGIDERVNALNENASRQSEEVDLDSPLEDPTGLDSQTPEEQPSATDTGTDASPEQEETPTSEQEQNTAEEVEEPEENQAPPSEAEAQDSPESQSDTD